MINLWKTRKPLEKLWTLCEFTQAFHIDDIEFQPESLEAVGIVDCSLLERIVVTSITHNEGYSVLDTIIVNFNFC